MALTFEDVLENSKSNKFTIQVVIALSLQWFVPGAHQVLISNVAPYIQCQFGLTNFEAALTGAAYFLGLNIGALYFGYMSDKRGRKASLVFAVLLMLYFAFLNASSQSATFFSLTRLFVGIGVTATYLITTTLTAEYVKVKHRSKDSLALALCFIFGMMYAYLISYLVLNRYGWRVLTLILCTPGLFFALLLKIVPESFRYLQTTNKEKKLMEILHRFARTNDVQIPSNLDLQCRESKNKASYRYVLKTYPITTCLFLIIWIGAMTCFYGSSFLLTYRLQNPVCKPVHHKQYLSATIATNSTNNCTDILPDSAHLQSFLISLSMVPGSLIMYRLGLYGRKLFMQVGFALNLICYILQLFCIPDWLSIASLLILNSTATIFGTYGYLLTVEAYPTVVRSSATGMISSVGKISQVFIPFLFQFLIYESYLGVMWFLIGLTALSMICVLPLEETYKKKLEQE
ncbi:synaptic vesicle 2-related protein-like [Clytia hemisphaerica]|uniref:synaptic vesicle 2-related protein-like n=1 Tax=Clytia hemisphaerica TaxID=252671 RepID=UPI0034D6C985